MTRDQEPDRVRRGGCVSVKLLMLYETKPTCKRLFCDLISVLRSSRACRYDVCASRQSTKNPDFAASSFVIACAMQPKGYRLDTLFRLDLHKRMHTSSELECAQTTGKKGSPVPPARHWWAVFLSIATCVRGKTCRMIDRTIMASFGEASYVYLYCSLGVSRMRTRWSNVAMAAQARAGIWMLGLCGSIGSRTS